jgi:hypothetical protein
MAAKSDEREQVLNSVLSGFAVAATDAESQAIELADVTGHGEDCCCVLVEISGGGRVAQSHDGRQGAASYGFDDGRVLKGSEDL